MILDSIANYKNYRFPKKINETFGFLEKAQDLKPDKYFLDNGIFVLIQEYATQKKEERKLENHKKYIDIQYIIKGNESIGLTFSGKNIVPYDEVRDLELYEGKDFLLELRQDDFLFLLPQELHRPGVGNGDFVKKAIVKIPVELFYKV